MKQKNPFLNKLIIKLKKLLKSIVTNIFTFFKKSKHYGLKTLFHTPFSKTFCILDILDNLKMSIFQNQTLL